ncbi:MAG: alpha-amylase family glycosyl hydrolase [Terracidiphilus sp.]
MVHSVTVVAHSPYRDWYCWQDGKGQTATDKGLPPNNWQSLFGHTAWRWDETTRQYYYPQVSTLSSRT